jgi:hypothetical protein
MKHAREDYNRIQDPAGLIPEDEPVFLLRGQDIFAPELVLAWARKALEEAAVYVDGDMKTNLVHMSLLAQEQALRMMDWQKYQKHKIPDYDPDAKVGRG